MISAVKNSTHLGVKIHATGSGYTQTRALNLAFLIDNSGSMEGGRLAAVKRTLHAARELFISTDQVTMVTFESKAATVADHILLDETGITEFYAAVDSICSAGCTNLSDGFERLVRLQQFSAPFDALLLLTDGLVNQGLTSTVALRTMGLGLCVGSGLTPITAIGYGAEHNRILLRELALHSRGAYVYVDDEDSLPTTMGDFLSGLRTEVLRDASVHVPAGWVCCEAGSTATASNYMVGNIVPDRDYWVIFKKISDVEDGVISLTATGHRESAPMAPYSDCYDLDEQVLRCRVAAAISYASDRMEAGCGLDSSLKELAAEFANLSETMRMRPLILRMQAQIAEIIASSSLLAPASLLARMSAGGATLSTQRGDSHYSSPCQRTASQRVQQQSQAQDPTSV